LPLAELPSLLGAIRRRHRSARYAGLSGAPPGSRPASRDHAKLEVNIGACAERIRLGVGNGGWGYIGGTYDKDAGANNQRLYLNGMRVAQMSDAQPIDLNSAPLAIGRHVSGIADPFNGYIDEFRIAHVQRSDRWIRCRRGRLPDGVRAIVRAGSGRRPRGTSTATSR
jgi:hypothetical protein